MTSVIPFCLNYQKEKSKRTEAKKKSYTKIIREALSEPSVQNTQDWAALS